MHTMLTLYTKRAKFTKKCNATSIVPFTCAEQKYTTCWCDGTRDYAKERCKIVGQIRRKW
jgi:hypothetical protein